MIDPWEYRNIRSWLDESRQPLLISHRRPDGDALGALAALARLIQRSGVEPYVALYEPLPPRYGLLSEMTSWHLWENVKDVLSKDCDSVVILDTCSLSQLEPILDYLRAAPRMLVVDHHATYDDIGTRSGDLRVFDDTAGACSLMIAEFARVTGAPIDAPTATALFTGIATDCGWFRFSNTDPRMFRAAADLIDAGADVPAIYSAIYQREQLPKLRLISRMLDTLELYADGRLAVMRLRIGDFEAAGADASMTEDLVNEAGRLGSTEATILLIEEGPDLIRANFRSKSVVDVSALASRYGGGGHARAAGARLRGAWDYVVPRAVQEMIEAVEGAMNPQPRRAPAPRLPEA